MSSADAGFVFSFDAGFVTFEKRLEVLARVAKLSVEIQVMNFTLAFRCYDISLKLIRDVRIVYAMFIDVDNMTAINLTSRFPFDIHDSTIPELTMRYFSQYSGKFA